MSAKLPFDRARSYLDCHLGLGGAAPAAPTARQKIRTQPSVTISRQTGTGGIAIAGDIADYLNKNAPKSGCDWTVFDKNLVEMVLEKLNLPSRLASTLPEDRVSSVTDAVEELLGLHPPSWTLLRQMSETILHLAEMGNVIVVGRGSSVITAGLEHVFHVRFVGSIEVRIARVMARQKMAHKEAARFVEREDAGRRRYLKRHFGKDIDDPLQYDLVINTDRIERAEVARLIGETVIRRYY